MLLFPMLCFGGQTFIVGKHGMGLGGGGHTNKCNFVENNQNKVVSWRVRSFPIPIVISKDISNRRTRIALQAITIWNDLYHQYLQNYVPDYRSKNYPNSLLEYDSIDPDDLYIDWFWYIFPLTAPFVILDRIIRFPGAGRGIIEQPDNYFKDNLHASGRTFFNDDGSYIYAVTIKIPKKLAFNKWHNSHSSTIRGMDYLTIVLHELGHLIGLAHDRTENTLMHAYTHPGNRYLPGKRDMDHIFCQYKKYWNQATPSIPHLRGTLIP